jgi:hypothetical protein
MPRASCSWLGISIPTGWRRIYRLAAWRPKPSVRDQVTADSSARAEGADQAIIRDPMHFSNIPANRS